MVWHHAPVSFDLVVWAMDKTDLPDAVRAANARCARGEHPQRPPTLGSSPSTTP